MSFAQLLDTRLSFKEETGALLRAFPSLGAVEAQSEIQRRRRARNASQPIHRLPTELLVLIFADAVHVTEHELFTRKKSDGIDPLQRLAGVSSVWKEIVKGCPQLWTVVDGRDAPRTWGSVLALSMGTAIMVALPPAPHFDTHFWEAISKEVVRWRSARLGITYDADLSPLGTTAAPELIRIDLARSGDKSMVVDLFRGVAPRLRNLKLTNVSLLNWDSPFLSSARLKVLSLTKIDSSAPSVQQLAHTLRSCSALEELTLWMVRYNKHEVAASLDPQSEDPVHPISLPKLRDLTMYPVTSGLVTHILQLLRTPTCSKVVLGSAPSDNGPNAACVTHVSPLLKSALTSAARISLSFDAWGCRIEVYNHLRMRAPSFSARVLAESTELSIDWAFVAFGRTLARLTTILALEGLPPFSLPYFLTVLRRLPSLKSLRLRGGHICAVLDLLGTAQPHPNDAWACPRLENLHFEGCTYCRAVDIWNVVDARARAARTGAWLEVAGIARVSPVRLRSLDVSHWSKMDAGTFRRIEGLLGRVVARWHGAQALEDDEMEVDAPGDSDLQRGGALHPVADDGQDL